MRGARPGRNAERKSVRIVHSAVFAMQQLQGEMTGRPFLMFLFKECDRIFICYLAYLILS